MSLRSLNRQIESRGFEMARQRRCAVALMEQQKNQAFAQAERIPLPLAMGVAFAGGFVLQRFFNTPAPRTLLNWYLTYQAFSNANN